jgi:hypothetical protein
MKCFIGGSLIRGPFALIILAISAQISVAQMRWQKFSAPDGDFTIDFPTAPRHSSVPNNLEGSPIEGYSVITGRQSYGVVYQDAPQPVNAMSRESRRALAEGCRLSAQSTKRQLLRVRQLPGAVVECLSKGPSGNALYPTDHRLERHFVRGRRYYTLSAISWTAGGVDRASAKRFFSSFRLRKI